jgi:hypothetical protein
MTHIRGWTNLSRRRVRLLPGHVTLSLRRRRHSGRLKRWNTIRSSLLRAQRPLSRWPLLGIILRLNTGMCARRALRRPNSIRLQSRVGHVKSRLGASGNSWLACRPDAIWHLTISWGWSWLPGHSVYETSRRWISSYLSRCKWNNPLLSIMLQWASSRYLLADGYMTYLRVEKTIF